MLALRPVVCSWFAILMLGGAAFAFAPAPSVNDGFSPNVDGVVYNLELQPDGQMLISGSFTYINGRLHQGNARLRPDGTLDESFASFISGSTKFKVLPDGKVLATQIYYDQDYHYLVRLTSDGTVDPTFTGNIYGYANTILVQPDSKILAVCRETTSSFSYSVVRLNQDGSRDGGFLCNSTAMLGYGALQADGRIVVAGAPIGQIEGIPFTGIARLNTNGSLDTTFDPGIGANSIVDWVAVQPDGKILMGGRFTRYGGVNRAYIARLNTDGSLDTSFTPAYNANVTHLIVQPNGKILTVGKFTTVNGSPRSGMARLNADGSLDQTFDVGSGISSGTVYGVAMQIDGTVVAVGDFSMFDGFSCSNIVKLGAYGTVDATFNSGGVGTDGSVNAIAVQPDGKMLCGGAFTQVFSAPWGRLTRFNLDGTADLSFNKGAGMNAEVVSIAAQEDGNIIVGGAFTTVNGIGRNHIARLKSDGSLDTSTLELGANGSVNTLARQADGKWVVGGDFSSILGVKRNRIARLNADLTLDATFNPGGGPNDSIKSISIQPDGRLVVAGNFTQFNGVPNGHLVRLKSNGSLDSSLSIGTGANDHIRSAIVQSDGKILISGSFTTFNQSARNRIARLLSDGSFDPSFVDASANNPIIAMALQTNGKIIIGGDFTKIGAAVRNHIARLNADGSLDTAFDVGSGANDRVSALALQIDGKVVLGGMFTTVRAYSRNHIARMSNPDAARQALSVSPAGDSVIWRIGGSYPQPSLVLFEESSNGTIWTALGLGAPVPGVGYRLAHLALPQKQNHYIRARAWASCGYYNGSVSPLQSVLLFNNLLTYNTASDWAAYK